MSAVQIQIREIKSDSERQDDPLTLPEMMQLHRKVRSQWIDAKLKAIMPPELYALTHSEPHSAEIKNWIKSQELTIMDEPGTILLLRHGTAVDGFKYTWRKVGTA